MQSPTKAEMLLMKHGYAPSAAIEQARTPGSSSSISSPSYQDRYTVANSTKISELDSTRDLYEMREHLRSKVTTAIDKLTTVRGELERSADRLMASRSVDAYNAASAYSPSSSSSKVELRNLVLDLSRQLEVAEAEYIAINKDYESVEQQLAEMIKKIQEEPVTNTMASSSPSSSSSSAQPIPIYQMSDLESISTDTKPIAKLDVDSVPIIASQALKFTVEEVLLGTGSLLSCVPCL